MPYSIGKVRQIDVRNFGTPATVRCFAIITPRAGKEVQVFTEDARLQSALELAFAMTAAPPLYVQVDYEEVSPTENVVTGVQMPPSG